MKKINSIHFGGKLLAAGSLLGAVIPSIIYLISGTFLWYFCVTGGAILTVFGVILAVELHQDNGNEPYYMKHLSHDVHFDPGKHTAVIHASICTGEMVAGFKDNETGHFTEVAVIRSDKDKRQFMNHYGIIEIKKEY